MATSAMATAELTEAIQLVLRGWPLLQLAVKNEWGGPDSNDKAEWLVDVLCEVLNDRKKYEIYDIEDTLDDILGNEFSTVAQDGSVAQVAQLLVRIREELAGGNMRGLEELRARYAKSSDALASVLRASAADPSSAADDDDGDDDDEESGEWVDDEGAASSAAAGASAATASAATASAGDAMDVDTEPTPRSVPEPDEDGFITVPSRKRGGRR